MEKVWRFRYCFLHKGPTQIIKALRMLPICHFSSPKRPDAAGQLLEKMVETGSSPSIVTYTTLIRGFLKSNMTPLPRLGGGFIYYPSWFVDLT
ncbi:hypothetical protein ACFX1R_048391 [Malus domestica]